MIVRLGYKFDFDVIRRYLTGTCSNNYGVIDFYATFQCHCYRVGKSFFITVGNLENDNIFFATTRVPKNEKYKIRNLDSRIKIHIPHSWNRAICSNNNIKPDRRDGQSVSVLYLTRISLRRRSLHKFTAPTPLSL